jgi:hypothetical protein
MASHLSITRFISAVMLLDIVLLALLSFSGTEADAVLAGLLPGHFGPGMGTAMTGNRMLGALILLLNALAFVGVGFNTLLRASRHGLVAGSGGVWRLLYGTAGQSRNDIATASLALVEDQRSEIHKLLAGRTLIVIGAVLLLLAFPALCFTYAQADAKGASLLRDADGPVANAAITAGHAVLFGADQFLDSVLLDVPRVYDLHLSPLRPAADHAWMRPLVLGFHILAKLIVLALLYAGWRIGKLRGFARNMVIPAAISLPAAPRETPLAVAQPANDYQAPVPATEAPPAAEPSDPGHDHGTEFALVPTTETQEPAPAGEAPASLSSEIRVLLLDTPADTVEEPVLSAQPEPAADAGEPSQPAEEIVEDTPSLVRERPRLFLVHPQAEATVPPPELSPAQEEEEPQAVLAPMPVAAESRADDFSDAPLALHELRNPDEMVSPAADNPDAVEKDRGSPYKRTALHVLPEFDA